MFPLSFTTFISPDSEKQRQKESDAARAAQVLRLRMEEQARVRQEETRKRSEQEITRARVHEFLKRVDQHIKKNELEEAQREIAQAKEIEPGNLYIRALEERLMHLREPEHLHHNDTTCGEQAMTTEVTIPQTSSAEAKRIAAKVIFQRVDQYIGAKDVAHAREDFKRACEMDPFNLAIVGYQQRIDALERELGRQALEEEGRQRMEERANAGNQQPLRSKRQEEKEWSGSQGTHQSGPSLESILEEIGEIDRKSVV